MAFTNGSFRGESGDNTCHTASVPTDSARRQRTSAAIERRPRLLDRTEWWLFGVVTAVHVSIALFIREDGWDDGAITLAFSRTFAHSGVIALTPISEPVEGFSSIMWFLIMSALAFVLPLGFGGLILASQLLAAVCAGVAAVLLYRLIGSTRAAISAIVCTLVFVFAPFINETANGMEMTLLTVEVLALLLAIRAEAPTLFVAAISGLIALTRFEAAAYLIGAGIVVLVLTRRWRPVAAMAIGVSIALALATVARIALFHMLVPNTIVAKRFPPYSPDSMRGRLISVCEVGVEILYVLGPALILAALGVTLLRRWPSRAQFIRTYSAPAPSFAIGYVLAAVAVNLVIGNNWGYLGRMEMVLAPVAVYLVATVAPLIIDAAVGRNLYSALALMIYIVLIAVGVDRAFFMERIDPDRAFAVTPSEYRQTAQAFYHVRDLLGMDSIVVLTPDIGGTSLCCSELKVLDLALLANKELANQGYGRIGSYLSKENPDIIEVHSAWAIVSDMYNRPEFTTQYVPISSEGIWMYLRADLAKTLATKCSWESVSARIGDRYRGLAATDEKFMARFEKTPICVL
jgi:hypothetical protein